MVYMQLDRTKLGEKRDEMETKAKEVLGEMAASQLLISDNSAADSFTFENGEITLIQTTPVGDVALGCKLSDDQMMQIVRYMTAKAVALKEVLSLANR